MANFTGILGTNNAQPGTLVLGKGPGGGEVSLATVVTVAQTIDFDIQQGLWKRLTQSITVSQTIFSSRDVPKSFSDSITVTPDVVGLPQPYARFTQDVLEVIYVSPGYARITQEVIEVVYKKANTQSVSHTITVTPSLIKFGDNNQQVTSTVSVTQTVIGRDNPNRQSVLQPITVSPLLSRAGPNHQSLSHTIVVTPTIINNTVQVVSHTVNVAQTIAARSTVIRQSLSNSITVTPSIADSTNKIPKSVQHDIAVNQTIDFEIIPTTGPRNVEMSVTHTIAVSQTCYGRNNVNRQSVTTLVGVSENEAERGDNTQHLSCTATVAQSIVAVVQSTHGQIAHIITVTPTIGVRNSVVRLAIAHTINVTSTPTSQELNISVSHGVVVTPTLIAIDSFVEQSVIQNVTLTPAIRYSPISKSVTDNVLITAIGRSYPSNDRITFEHRVFVTDTIFAQSLHETVTHNVSVDQEIETNRKFQTVQHVVFVRDIIARGVAVREISLSDNIAVGQTIKRYVTPNRQSVISNIAISSRGEAKTKDVEDSYADHIGVFINIVPNVLRPQIRQDLITVSQTVIGQCSSNRQAIAHSIAISTALRSSPKRQTVTSQILVTPRLSIFDLTVKHHINVTPLLQRIIEKSVTHSITVTPTINRNSVFGKQITDTLPITQSVIRGMIWYRSITQVLIIPDDSFLRQFSFWPSPLVISVATGTIVTKDVVLRSKFAEIKLPAALLDDSKSNVDEVTIQRSMNSRTLVIIKSSDRQKLKLQFRVKAAKASEMMIFIKQNLSELITLINWNGEIWVGRFMSNPFELTNAGRWATVREFVTFEIEFEGTKTSG